MRNKSCAETNDPEGTRRSANWFGICNEAIEDELEEDDPDAALRCAGIPCTAFPTF